MKVFLYVMMGSLTLCNAALLKSDQAQNSVDYPNEGEKEEIITIFEESDLNQNYQQDPAQNYLPPTSSADEIIQTIKIVEELQPVISSSSAHTEAHFPSAPSHQFEPHYSEQQSGYLPPIQDQPQEYLPPIQSQAPSGYLPPLAESQPQHVQHVQTHQYQQQFSEYLPPTAGLSFNPKPHSTVSQTDYLPPIQSQEEYLPPSPPAQIEPHQQYVPPVHQHSPVAHQPQQEYIPPASSHPPGHEHPHQPQQKLIQTIRVIHESAAAVPHDKPKFGGVRTLRIIKSFAPHHTDQHVKALNVYHNQPKQVHQPSHVSSSNLRSKTLRIIHSSANPVIAPGHHSKTLKIASAPFYNQHNHGHHGATRTIRIIKQIAPVQPNGHYLNQGRAKKL